MQKACNYCRSRQELSNEYFLAKCGVDTAENEPLKVLLLIQPWDSTFTEPPLPYLRNTMTQEVVQVLLLLPFRPLSLSKRTSTCIKNSFEFASKTNIIPTGLYLQATEEDHRFTAQSSCGPASRTCPTESTLQCACCSVSLPSAVSSKEPDSCARKEREKTSKFSLFRNRDTTQYEILFQPL